MLAIGVGSLVLGLLHSQREGLAEEVPVLDIQDPMGRHTPEVWQGASHTAGNWAGVGETCSVLTVLHSLAEP